MIVRAQHRGAWVSWVVWVSKLMMLEPVGGKTAAAVTEAITQRMGPFRDRVHTCTADNGKGQTSVR